MPRTTAIGDPILALLRDQERVASRAQLAAGGVTRHVISRRLGDGRWTALLPGVIGTFSGHPTRQQLLIAAHLWAGPDSAIDALDACVWHGLPASFATPRVHVVAPWGSGLRSRDFVVVRRTMAEIEIGDRGLLPYVDAATAFIVAARNTRSTPAAITLLSRGLALAIVTEATLRAARERLGDKFCAGIDRALVEIGVGLRSPAERDARQLISTSRILPEPGWNTWLDLGDSMGWVCVDALWREARLVHEVNGKRPHLFDQSFDQWQRRHDRLVAAGLVSLHNTPARIVRDGASVLAEIERSYQHNEGRGMPPGVRIVPPAEVAAWLAHKGTIARDAASMQRSAQLV